MCSTCDKEVIDMGILESDLPNLPFTVKKWRCMCHGCKGATKIRDYGIAPLYYWPVKVQRRKNKDGIIMWRGGWTNADHGYICSRHFPQYKLDDNHFMQKYLYQHLKTANPDKVAKYLLTKVEEIIAKRTSSYLNHKS